MVRPWLFFLDEYIQKSKCVNRERFSGNFGAMRVGFLGRSFQQATGVSGGMSFGSGTGHGPLTACMPLHGVLWKSPRSSMAAESVVMVMAKRMGNDFRFTGVLPYNIIHKSHKKL